MQQKSKKGRQKIVCDVIDCWSKWKKESCAKNCGDKTSYRFKKTTLLTYYRKWLMAGVIFFSGRTRRKKKGIRKYGLVIKTNDFESQ